MVTSTSPTATATAACTNTRPTGRSSSPGESRAIRTDSLSWCTAYGSTRARCTSRKCFRGRSCRSSPARSRGGSAMPEPLDLTIALLNHGQTDALRDGRVQPRGIALRHVEVNPPPMIYRRMVRNPEFDVAEVATTTFLCAKSVGKPISAIPVFSNRDLTLTPLVCGTGSGINAPKDLEGKRVGMRSYTETNTTQTRALLRSELGVDTDRVRWVITEDAHVAEYEPPSNVEMQEGADQAAMLKSGELDALLAPRIQAGYGQKLLWTESEAEEVAVGYWRRTGVYPIGHIMAVKDETLQANP